MMSCPIARALLTVVLVLIIASPSTARESTPSSGDVPNEGMRLAPVVGVDPDFLYADLLAGAVDVQTLTLSNTGDSELIWKIDIREPGDRGSEERMPADLTGVTVLWDRFHGQSSWALDWTTIVADLESRGATLIENVAPITPALLVDVEVFWTTDCGNSWTGEEITALADWVRAGGGLLLEGDNSPSVGAYNLMLAALAAGIEFSSVDGTDGITTHVHPHDTTEDVTAIYIYDTTAHLYHLTAPAESLVTDMPGAPNAACSQAGWGRIVALADELLADYAMGVADNQLFGNQVFDWLVLGGVDWLSVDPRSGTLPAGGSLDLAVTFDAAELIGGDYRADLTVLSNDPITPALNVPILLHVTGTPDIALDPGSFDFGTVLIGVTAVDTLIVSNAGTDPLTVTGIVSDHPDFTLDPTSFALPSGESRAVTVAFSPSSEAVITGSLTLSSDDPDEGTLLVPVAGEGLFPPVVGADPDSLYADLFSGDSEIQTLTLSNTGGSDLIWEIDFRKPGGPRGQERLEDLTDVTILWDRAHGQSSIGGWSTMVSELESRGATVIQNFFPITPALLTDVDVFWTTDCVNSWTEAEISTLADWVPAGGGFLLEGDNDASVTVYNRLLGDMAAGIDYSTVNGSAGTTPNIHSHETTADVAAIHIGSTSARIFSAVDPAGLLIDDVAGVPNSAYSLPRLGRIVALADELLANNVIGAANNKLFGNQVFDWLAVGGFSWLSVDPIAGTLPAGGSLDLSVTFDAAELYGGDYLADLKVRSNDPITPELRVATRLHVTGVPDIVLDPESFDFGLVSIGTTVVDTLLLANAGTDLLTVAGIVSDHPDFTLGPSSFALPPGESRAVTVAFSPSSEAEITGTLTVTSDDPDEGTLLVPVAGEGQFPPVVGADPDSLYADLHSGDSEIQTLTLSNTGGSDLIWEIALDERDGERAADRDARGDVSSRRLEEDHIGIFADPQGSECAVDLPLYTFVPCHILAHAPGFPDGILGATFRIGHLPLSGQQGIITYEWASPLIIGDAGTELTIVFSTPQIPDANGNVHLGIMELFALDPDWIGTDYRLQVEPGAGSSDIVVVDPVFDHIPVAGGRFTFNCTTQCDCEPMVTEPDWLSVDPLAGTLPAGGSLDLALTFDAAGLETGDYLTDLTVLSNDPINPELPVAIHLHVTSVPNIAVDPASLDFGPVIIGATEAAPLLVSNAGTELLTVTAIVSDQSDFTVDPSSFALAPGESRVVTVTFSPSSEGMITGTLVVTSDDPDEGTLLVPVAGEGLVAPVAGVEPDSLYADLLSGDSQTQAVTLSNTGGSDLIWRIGLRKHDDLRRREYLLAVPDPLPPAADRHEGGEARPARAPLPLRARLADLTDVTVLWDRSHGQTSWTDGWTLMVSDLVSRGATVLENSSPITQALLEDVKVFWTTDCWYSWTEAEIAALADWVLGGGGLLLEGDDSSSVLAYNLLLDALAAGISYDAVDGTAGTSANIHPHETTADVTAIHLYDPVAHLSAIVEPAGLLFDDVAGVPNSAYSLPEWGRVVAVADELFSTDVADNRLFGNQVLDWLALGGVDWLRTDPAAGTLPAGGSQDLAVTFNAAGVNDGHYFADLQVSSNDPITPELRVATHLHVTGAPGITLSTSEIDFGNVFVGMAKLDSLLVGNAGTGLLSVTSVSVDHADFSVSPADFLLPPGQSQVVEVAFEPAGAGPVEALLTIESDDPNEPVSTVALLGEGLLPPDITVDPDSLLVTLVSGGTDSRVLSIANNGGSELNWELMIADRAASAGPMPSAAGERDETNYLGIFSDTGGTVCAGDVPLFVMFQYYLLAHLPDFPGGLTAVEFSLGNYQGNPGPPLGITTFQWATSLVIGDPETGIALAFSVPQVPDANGNIYLGTMNVYALVPDWIGPDRRVSMEPYPGQAAIKLIDDHYGMHFVPGSYFTFNCSADCGCFIPTSLPSGWLSVDPASGVVPPAQTQAVELRFDAVGLQNGFFYKDLQVASNDPDHPLITVSVTLHVDDTIPVFLNTFDIEAWPGVVEVRWELNARGAPGEFRLLCTGGQAEREIAYEQETPTTFIARDEDELLASGGTFTYALHYRDAGDWLLLRSDEIEVPKLPLTTALLPAFPNPFNPHVTVPFTLAGEQRVRIAVYDIGGRRVIQLCDRRFERGRQELTWTGRDEAADPVASGVYIIRMEAQGYARSQKLILLR